MKIKAALTSLFCFLSVALFAAPATNLIHQFTPTKILGPSDLLLIEKGDATAYLVITNRDFFQLITNAIELTPLPGTNLIPGSVNSNSLDAATVAFFQQQQQTPWLQTIDANLKNVTNGAGFYGITFSGHTVLATVFMNAPLFSGNTMSASLFQGGLFSGTFNGNGSGLASLNGANITGGTVNSNTFDAATLALILAQAGPATIRAPGTITTNAFATSLLEGQSRSVVQSQKPIWGFDTYYSSWTSANGLPTNVNIYCSPTEIFVLRCATNLVNDGWISRARQFGTEFWFSVSDGWQGGRSNGVMFADTNAFPHGMPWLVNTLHGMGFKVRFYTEVGAVAPQTTCCGKINWINSGGTNSATDALTFTQWGVDGVTVDTCVDVSGISLTKRWDHEVFNSYLRSNNAAINYDIHLSPTAGQYPNGFEPWMAEFNSWQYAVEYGVANATNSFLDRCRHVDLANQTRAYLRPGGSPNLLIIDGNFTDYNNNVGKLMMTMWSMFQSPLVFSQDFILYSTVTDPEFAKCVTNYWCLRIDQDKRFIPPTETFTNGLNSECWLKPLDDGSVALALINRWTNNETLSVDLTAVSAVTNSTHVLLDAWFNTNYTASGIVSFSCPSNSCQLWIIDPALQTISGSGNARQVLIQSGVPTGSPSVTSLLSVQDPLGTGISQLAVGHGSGFEYQLGRNSANGFLRINGSQAAANGVEFFGGPVPTNWKYATLAPSGLSVTGSVTAATSFISGISVGLTTNINVIIAGSKTNQLQFVGGILTGVVPQ